MFIRIAWLHRPVTGTCHVRPSLRPNVLPNRRTCDDLDIPPRDFFRMTKGLFDRQD